MPQVGGPELIIVLAIILIVFGVGRLPEVGGALGKGIREFRKSQKDSGEEPSHKPEGPTESKS